MVGLSETAEQMWEENKHNIETYEEACDYYNFLKSYDNGEVCIDGYEMGKCPLWCSGNPEAKKEMA